MIDYEFKSYNLIKISKIIVSYSFDDLFISLVSVSKCEWAEEEWR